MYFYDDDDVQNDLKALDNLNPDWEYWARADRAKLKDFCFLTMKIEPRTFISYFECSIPSLESMIKETKDEEYNITSHLKEVGISEFDVTKHDLNSIESVHAELLVELNRLENRSADYEWQLIILLEQKSLLSLYVEDIYSLAKLDEKINSSLDQQEIVNKSDFIGWLDSLSIPYPDELKNCIRIRNKTEYLGDETTKERSNIALGQENSKLKQLFNSMVELHYGKVVSANKIADDFNNFTDEGGRPKKLTGSKGTITKHLNRSK